MKTLPTLLVAALLLLAGPATAQMTFDETQQVRIGYGDIPTTDAVERSGAWNIHETRVVQMEDGPVTFTPPTGAVFEDLSCDCEHTVTADGDRHTITFPDGANGTADVVFRSWYGGNDGRLAAHLALEPDSVVILWVESGTPVQSSHAVPAPLGSTPQNPGYDIYQFTDISPTAFWVTANVVPAPDAPGPSFGFDFVTLLLGLIAGAGLWAFLVTQGVVQKRSRKQVAGPAAHKEVASSQSPEMLATRKRILMAGLKDLELAKQDQNVDQATYDALKAEWKKQTVTVMRALEEAREE